MNTHTREKLNPEVERHFAFRARVTRAFVDTLRRHGVRGRKMKNAETMAGLWQGRLAALREETN